MASWLKNVMDNVSIFLVIVMLTHRQSTAMSCGKYEILYAFLNALMENDFDILIMGNISSSYCSYYPLMLIPYCKAR